VRKLIWCDWQKQYLLTPALQSILVSLPWQASNPEAWKKNAFHFSATG